MLENILNHADMQQAIVFTSTKRAADQLAQTLHSLGLSAAAMHGDMNQGARNRTLQALRRGSLKVLVATDVAARGIDVQGISHVINYDLPTQAEDYVHRIGRTGRAGRNGVAISFANVRDHHMVRSIERFTTQKIEVTAILGLEPKMRAFSKPAPRNTRPGGGKTFSRPNAAPGGRREGFGGYAKRDGRPAGRSPARTSPYK
jgi:superfamily II DNA/RNA helicase